MKLAYWPGCVSRGFTPELHGSVAKVAPLLDLELVELDRANCCGAGVIAEHNQELVDTLNARTFALAQKVDGAAGRIGSPGAALKRGIFFSSGDRATESVFAELGVMENATLGARRDLGPAGLILGKRQQGKFAPLAEQLDEPRQSLGRRGFEFQAHVVTTTVLPSAKPTPIALSAASMRL